MAYGDKRNDSRIKKFITRFFMLIFFLLGFSGIRDSKMTRTTAHTTYKPQSKNVYPASHGLYWISFRVQKWHFERSFFE